MVAALQEAGIPVFARSDSEYRATRVTLALEAMALVPKHRAVPATQLGELLDDWRAAAPAVLEHRHFVRIRPSCFATPIPTRQRAASSKA